MEQFSPQEGLTLLTRVCCKMHPYSLLNFLREDVSPDIMSAKVHSSLVASWQQMEVSLALKGHVRVIL